MGMGQSKNSRAVSPSRTDDARNRPPSPTAVISAQIPDAVDTAVLLGQRAPAPAPVPAPAPAPAIALTSRAVSQGDVARRRGQSRSGDRQASRALTTNDDGMPEAVSVVPQPHRPRPRSRLLPVSSGRPGPVGALYAEAVANIEQTRPPDLIEPSAVEAMVGSSAPPQVSSKASSLVRRSGGSAISFFNPEEAAPAKHTSSEGAFLKSSTALPPAKGASVQLDLTDDTNSSTPVPETNSSSGGPDSVSIQSEQSMRPSSEAGDTYCEEHNKAFEEIYEIDMIAPPSATGFYFGNTYCEGGENADYFDQVQKATLASFDAVQCSEERPEDLPEAEENTNCEIEPKLIALEQVETRLSESMVPLDAENNQKPLPEESDKKECSLLKAVSSTCSINTQEEPVFDTENFSLGTQEEPLSGIAGRCKHETESTMSRIGTCSLEIQQELMSGTSIINVQYAPAVTVNVFSDQGRSEVTEIVKASTVLTAASSIAATSGSLTAMRDQMGSYPSGSDEAADLGEAAGDDSLVGCEVHLKAVAGGIIEPAADLPPLLEDQELAKCLADRQATLAGNNLDGMQQEEEDEVEREDDTSAAERNDPQVNKLELKRHHSEQPGQGGLNSTEDAMEHMLGLTEREDTAVLTSRSESSTGRIRTLGGGKISSDIRSRNSSDATNRINRLIQSCKDKISLGKLGVSRRPMGKRNQHRLKLSTFSKTFLKKPTKAREQHPAIAEASQDEAASAVLPNQILTEEECVAANTESQPSASSTSHHLIVDTLLKTEENCSEDTPSDTSTQAVEDDKTPETETKKNHVAALLDLNSESRNVVTKKSKLNNRSRSFLLDSESHLTRLSQASIAPPRTNFLSEDVLKTLARRSYVIGYSDSQVGFKPRQASKTPERYRSAPDHKKVKPKSGTTSASTGSPVSSSVTSTPKLHSTSKGVQKSKSLSSKRERKPRSYKDSKLKKRKDCSSNSILSTKKTISKASESIENEEGSKEESKLTPQKQRESNIQRDGILHGKREDRLMVRKSSTDNNSTDKAQNLRRISFQKILESPLEDVKTFKSEFDALLQNPFSKLLNKSESFQENRPTLFRTAKPHSCILGVQERENSLKNWQREQKRSISGRIEEHSKEATSQGNSGKTPNFEADEKAREPETEKAAQSTQPNIKKFTDEPLPRYRPTLRTPRISSVGMHAGNEGLGVYRKNLVTDIKPRSKARIATKQYPSRTLHTQLQTSSEQHKISKTGKSRECTGLTNRAEPLKTSFEGLEEITKLLKKYTALKNLTLPSEERSELVSLFEAPTKYSIPSEDNESRGALGTTPRPSADEMAFQKLPGSEAMNRTSSTEAVCALANIPSTPSPEERKIVSLTDEASASACLLKDEASASACLLLSSKNKPAVEVADVLQKETDTVQNSYNICSKDTEIKVAAALHEEFHESVQSHQELGSHDDLESLDNLTLSSLQTSHFEFDRAMRQLRLPVIQISPPFPEDDPDSSTVQMDVRSDIDQSKITTNAEHSENNTMLPCDDCHGLSYHPSPGKSTFAQYRTLATRAECVDKGINTSSVQLDAPDDVSATIITTTWRHSPSRQTITKVSDAVQASVATADMDSQVLFSLESLEDCRMSSIECSKDKLFYRRRPVPAETDDHTKKGISTMIEMVEEDNTQSHSFPTDRTLSKEYIPRSFSKLLETGEDDEEFTNESVQSAPCPEDSVSYATPKTFANGQESSQGENPVKLGGVERAQRRIAAYFEDLWPISVIVFLSEELPELLVRAPSELHSQRLGQLKHIFTHLIHHPLLNSSQPNCSNEVLPSNAEKIVEKLALLVEDVARSAEASPYCQDGQRPP